ncbi:MAG: DoxX family protein [Lentimicrobiaceae bacterium]|jgi:putative oxidoreductase|nr:DoxX family protein [Lentimicrobiaceae bacterium]
MKIFKLFFSTKLNNSVLQVWLLALRLLIGAFMLTHGIPKFQILISGSEIQFLDPIGLGVTFSFVLIVFAEFFCSILLMLGFFTRLASIPLLFSMLVATFVAHGSDPFATKELSLLYALVYATILFAGSGKYAFDYLIYKKLK